MTEAVAKQSGSTDETLSDRSPETLQQKLAEADRKLREAEMLLSVSRTVAGLDSLDNVLEVLVDIAARELDAERATLFLNDEATKELYSRVAQGTGVREIRILNASGIAGAVFQSGQGEIVADAYGDERFNREVDEETGYTTESLCCAPVRTVRGDVIGVVQCLNKRSGAFDAGDLRLLELITTQAAMALQSTQMVERMQARRAKEQKFLNIVTDVTSELELGALLTKVMNEATDLLNADRSTLFMHDDKTNELFSRVAMGGKDGNTLGEIRLPNNAGIAGTVFTTRESVNIPYAYADLRFNPSFDKQTGYFTRSILCVPVVNKNGKTIGVTQVLNKRGGPFTDDDERRLKAFTGQIAVALETAKLFEDVQAMKNYNESMLQSMSNGVITTDEDGKIVTCNYAGLKIIKAFSEAIVGQHYKDFFSGDNAWVAEKISELESGHSKPMSGPPSGPLTMMDASYSHGITKSSINATFLPLLSHEGGRLGAMIMLEDISAEKRMKSTMSRYMDATVAERLMAGGEDLLGGKSTPATVLFSDVRSFTTITEQLGAQGTVKLLNEYFTIMVDCITEQDGMLDKFIGDALMAGFGIPIAHDDDEDRAVRAGIAMIRSLRDWNLQRRERGELEIDMGLGINTDRVVSGNIGSPKRMDYTMIGDGVNLAARLESACKQYAARILISEFTYAGLKGTYRTRNVDQVIVKGKTEPVGVYEVLDYHTPDTFPNLMDNVNYFNEGVRMYRRGDWDDATRHFREALKANAGDRLAQTYIDRCTTLKAEPPKDWDGVWVMTSK